MMPPAKNAARRRDNIERRDAIARCAARWHECHMAQLYSISFRARPHTNADILARHGLRYTIIVNRKRT